MRALPLSLLPALVALPCACSDAALYDPAEIPSQPDKVAFTGTVCTDNPAERSFPLRVVFVVDASANIPYDPALDTQFATLSSQFQTLRVGAVRDAVNLLRSPDNEFALIRYGGTSFITPEGGFTSNSSEISEAAGALTVPIPGSSDGIRVLGQALSLAASIISGDLLSTAKGPRSRTKYIIVVMQHGPTDDNVLCPATAPGCDPAVVMGTRMRDLREFVIENGGADFQVHALDLASLTNRQDGSRETAAQELQQIAFNGAGEYRPVCPRDDLGTKLDPSCDSKISLLGMELDSARNVFLTKSFVVTNLSAITTNEGAIPDSDSDGLSDEEEPIYGTDPTRRDTDGDGLGDKVELLLSTVGVNPLAPDDPISCMPIEPDLRPILDTDGDGLLDCEEALLRLDATLFDSDADGVPDLLEVISGTNFLEDDGLTDSDFDGVPNINELKAHTDPRSADAKARNELGYLYRETDLGISDMLFSTQPRDLSGVVIEDVRVGSSLGNAQLSFVFQGGNPPLLAWRDASEGVFGPAVEITEDGFYTLTAACTGIEGCTREVTVSVTAAILPPFSVDESVRVALAQRQCTSFRIRNVTLVETLAAEGRTPGYNDVRIYFGQVPSGVPDAYGIFRLAQFPFTFIKPDFKNPNVADQLVEDFNFVLFE